MPVDSSKHSAHLRQLLSAQQPVFESINLQDWFVEFDRATKDSSNTIFNAVLGGRRSTFLGQAFLAGYQSAIEFLLQPKPRQLASFCVTEEGGNHPREIVTTLTPEGKQYVLSGAKSFVSGGPQAKQLFIACRINHPDEPQARLRIVSLPANASGIQIDKMPPLPFIPEIPHGKLRLENVRVSPEQILSGDGYSDFVKPFRTVEDLHVLAAVAGYRLSMGLIQNWPQTSLEEYAALVSGLLGLGETDPKDPAMHLALAGFRSLLTRLNDETDPFFESADPHGFELWRRDQPLLQIASRAHARRSQKARAVFWPNLSD